jgi:hypothetical protein
MTALYIANPTKQVQIICYRLDYNKKGEDEVMRRFQPAKQQDIQPGRQAMIGSRDFHLTQVQDIVDQLEPYGIIAAKEVGRLPRKKINYVFNVDSPVPADVMRAIQNHNNGVQIEEGRDRRAKSAVASNDLVQQTVQQQFMEQGIPAEPSDSTTVAFEQLEQSEAGEKTIAEGFEIVPEGKTGPRSGKPAARNKSARKR